MTVLPFCQKATGRLYIHSTQFSDVLLKLWRHGQPCALGSTGRSVVWMSVHTNACRESMCIARRCWIFENDSAMSVF